MRKVTLPCPDVPMHRNALTGKLHKKIEPRNRIAHYRDRNQNAIGCSDGAGIDEPLDAATELASMSHWMPRRSWHLRRCRIRSRLIRTRYRLDLRTPSRQQRPAGGARLSTL